VGDNGCGWKVERLRGLEVHESWEWVLVVAKATCF
jgi:hypothetical protein